MQEGTICKDKAAVHLGHSLEPLCWIQHTFTILELSHSLAPKKESTDKVTKKQGRSLSESLDRSAAFQWLGIYQEHDLLRSRNISIGRAPGYLPEELHGLIARMTTGLGCYQNPSPR